uniref:Uncharacterized protein n=1 Tax=Candidatus Kentrum sp. TUN TaxID=2126343 RepID=A0A450ZS09_9GAMM|nr:MAG: hypothetical protein BECKTUN1418D_GA0071000_10497 [Candidatus Kentron sp. TUN]
MKNIAKAAALTMLIGMPLATFADEKAPIDDGIELAAFQGIETMQVSESELRKVSGVWIIKFGDHGVRGGKDATGDGNIIEIF